MRFLIYFIVFSLSGCMSDKNSGLIIIERNELVLTKGLTEYCVDKKLNSLGFRENKFFFTGTHDREYKFIPSDPSCNVGDIVDTKGTKVKIPEPFYDLTAEETKEIKSKVEIPNISIANTTECDKIPEPSKTKLDSSANFQKDNTPFGTVELFSLSNSSIDCGIIVEYSFDSSINRLNRYSIIKLSKLSSNKLERYSQFGPMLNKENHEFSDEVIDFITQ